MARSALRQSLPRRASLRSALPSHRLPAASEFCRSFQSGDGEISETMDEFEARIFGSKKGVDEGSLYRKVDKVENTSKRYGMGSGFMAGFSGLGNRSSSGSMGGYGAFGNRSSSGPVGGFDSLNDGMNEMLVNVARNFQMDDNNDGDDEFRADVDFRRGFRADVDFRRGGTYNARDLDPRRPAAAKNPPRPQFQTTTAEVLRKADFRNVRFLSSFLTEAGIIFKRSQTGISAKAQRKVAREIKTARAFGLMPFTTMGRKPFVFGRSAEEHYSDEEYGDFVKPGEDNGDAEPDVEAP